ncbi:unnamed protein product, partial [Ectocarpus sp. 13 AM-2016]
MASAAIEPFVENRESKVTFGTGSEAHQKVSKQLAVMDVQKMDCSWCPLMTNDAVPRAKGRRDSEQLSNTLMNRALAHTPLNMHSHYMNVRTHSPLHAEPATKLKWCKKHLSSVASSCSLQDHNKKREQTHCQCTKKIRYNNGICDR